MANDESYKSLLFSVKVGKSYKNKGWALNRDSTSILIPKLSYEDECDIILDGIHSKARFNIVPRIFYNNNDEIRNHLKKLSSDGVDRVDLELLLNHDDMRFDDETENLLVEINNLNHKLQDKDLEISDLKNKVKYFQSFENSKDEELIKLHDEIDELKSIIDNQDKELDDLFSSMIQLEIDNDEAYKKRLFYEDENKKLNDKLQKLLEIVNE